MSEPRHLPRTLRQMARDLCGATDAAELSHIRSMLELTAHKLERDEQLLVAYELVTKTDREWFRSYAHAIWLVVRDAGNAIYGHGGSLIDHQAMRASIATYASEADVRADRFDVPAFVSDADTDRVVSA